ncbi:hypothetical protein VPH35_007676 [Triticum aestivum]
MAVAFCHAQPSSGSYVLYARSHVCMPAPAKEGTVTGSQASVHQREKREHWRRSNRISGHPSRSLSCARVIEICRVAWSIWACTLAPALHWTYCVEFGVMHACIVLFRGRISLPRAPVGFGCGLFLATWPLGLGGSGRWLAPCSGVEGPPRRKTKHLALFSLFPPHVNIFPSKVLGAKNEFPSLSSWPPLNSPFLFESFWAYAVPF